MTGVLGGFQALDPIVGVDEILKAREDIEEFTDIPEPENPIEGISESPTVVVT